ncbi:MAG: hypothetical protein CSA10_00115 [Cardiobacteriales bacterium]|nr:MAG: hypothetical protein CSA10_00115 [Cardiobacteriales bacterium]
MIIYRQLRTIFLLLMLPVIAWLLPIHSWGVDVDNDSLLHIQTQIVDGKCYVIDNTIYLDLNSNIYLDNEPIEALKNGLPLSFLYQIELKEADKWFADKVSLTRDIHLNYNPVAQTFLYEDPITLKQVNHPSLEQALTAIGSMKSLPLIEVKQLPLSENAHAVNIRVRFLLNEELLPVSLRFGALFSKEWNIKSGWWTCRLAV